MHELDSLRIAVAMEEVDNPLLLLWRQQLLPAIVAVISAVSAQITLDLVAQHRIVLLLHLTIQQVKAPGQPQDASLSEKFALPTLPRSGINSRSPILPPFTKSFLLFALTLLLNPFAKVRKIGCVHFLQTFFLEVT